MERRQFARIPVNLQLKFKSFEALENLLEGAALDISPGGMFIRSRQVKPLGTVVEIELPVPGGEPALVRGVVRSIRYQQGEPFGMGIEFEGLKDPARGVILHLANKRGPDRG